MAITLYTGLPGHGKTLRVLSVMKPLAAAENRPVFHNDIPGLAIDGWQVHQAEKWFDLPATAYMVIDECQRVFPIRPRSGPVPQHVQELETHRHKGIDLVLVTQHPMLVDTNVRKLVDRHFHVVRKFGTKFATVYEFPTGVQDSPEKNRHKNGVVRHEWRYPKNAFEWYRSAEVHTVKSRLPAKVWLVLAALLMIPVFAWFVYVRLWVQHGRGAEVASVPGQVASAPGGGSISRPGRLASPGQVAVEYIGSFEPRIPGLAYTAPIYDSMTRPVEAPYPSVCMYSADMPCRCWSQRGFHLPVPKQLCETLAREPMDPFWLKRTPHGLAIPGESDAASGVQAGTVPLASPGAAVVAQAAS
jgi:hypothetical protein